MDNYNSPQLSPLIIDRRLVFKTADSAAQAAAVLFVETLVQSPIPNDYTKQVTGINLNLLITTISFLHAFSHFN